MMMVTMVTMVILMIMEMMVTMVTMVTLLLNLKLLQAETRTKMQKRSSTRPDQMRGLTNL